MMKARHLGVAVVLLLAGSLAHATTISYGGVVSTITAPSSSTVNLSQFDPALGTLTGVTMSVYARSNGTFAADSHASPQLSATPALDYSFSVSAPGFTGSDTRHWSGTTQALEGSTSPYVGNPFDVANPFDPSPAHGYDWGALTRGSLTVSPVASSAIAAGDWASYTGTGVAACQVNVASLSSQIDWAATGGTPLASLSGLYEDAATQGLSLRLVVQYAFDPAPPATTPEPCTLALLGLGVGGLTLRARRRSRR